MRKALTVIKMVVLVLEEGWLNVKLLWIVQYNRSALLWNVVFLLLLFFSLCNTYMITR